MPRALNKSRKALLFLSLPYFTRVKVAICQKLNKRSEPELTSAFCYFNSIHIQVLLAIGYPFFHISYLFFFSFPYFTSVYSLLLLVGDKKEVLVIIFQLIRSCRTP